LVHSIALVGARQDGIALLRRPEAIGLAYIYKLARSPRLQEGIVRLRRSCGKRSPIAARIPLAVERARRPA
jgi:hypothetical protein